MGIEELVLSYLYPRLDKAVSTGINHLLKSPFCVHPKTGNICVPFDSADVENFKLAEVPTLTMAINELGELSKEGRPVMEDGVASIPCLQPYIVLFKKHIKKCHLKQDRKNRQDKGEDDAMDF